MANRFAMLLLSLALVAGSPTVGAPPAMAGRSAVPDPPTVAKLLALSQAFVERRTLALVDGSGSAALSMSIDNDTARESVSFAGEEVRALSELIRRREVLKEFHEAYSSARAVAMLKNARLVGNRITLEIEESATLTYARVAGDEPPFTSFVTPRVFEFVPSGSSWLLVAETIPTQGPAPVDEPTGATAEAMRAGLRTIAPTNLSAAKLPRFVGTATPRLAARQAPAASQAAAAASYNYQAMADYAMRYWNNYNPAYRSFNDVGGDCTNFVSQALRAGGWQDKTGWYRDDNNWWYNWMNQTITRINVQYFYTFAAVRSGRTYILGSPSYMGLGDVLQIDFTNDGPKDHTMIVTYRSQQPYLTYHTTNTLNRSLSSLQAALPYARWIPHRT